MADRNRSAHDAVRRGDHVYISSTADGEVIQLSMPGLKEVARFELFTPHQHVNSLAPLREDRLWALLHNMGSVSPLSAFIHFDTCEMLPRARGNISHLQPSRLVKDAILVPYLLPPFLSLGPLSMIVGLHDTSATRCETVLFVIATLSMSCVTNTLGLKT